MENQEPLTRQEQPTREENAPAQNKPKKRKKVGIIRCQQTEDYCPGTTDFEAAASGEHGFAELGPVEIVGFVSCGGCPGKRAVARAEEMVRRGAKVIAFASCVFKGRPIGMPCPNAKAMRNAVERNVPGVKILDWTH